MLSQDNHFTVCYSWAILINVRLTLNFNCICRQRVSHVTWLFDLVRDDTAHKVRVGGVQVFHQFVQALLVIEGHTRAHNRGEVVQGGCIWRGGGGSMWLQSISRQMKSVKRILENGVGSRESSASVNERKTAIFSPVWPFLHTKCRKLIPDWKESRVLEGFRVVSSGAHTHNLHVTSAEWWFLEYKDTRVSYDAGWDWNSIIWRCSCLDVMTNAGSWLGVRSTMKVTEVKTGRWHWNEGGHEMVYEVYM